MPAIRFGVNISSISTSSFSMGALNPSTLFKLLPWMDGSLFLVSFFQVGYFWALDNLDDLLANNETTSITPQQVPYTLCVVCSDAEEFSSQPTKSSEITIPCWNPSGSASIQTDDDSRDDPKKFCIPNNGLCRTETWQYSTRSPMKTTSYWIGIERGCQADQDGSSSS